MSTGIIIFAHNSRALDYALMSIIAGGLAKKHLNVPVSLITDAPTLQWIKDSDKFKHASRIFDKIIEIDPPVTSNRRKLHDGTESSFVPFVNSSRSDAWAVTPYNRTLLIDSDYLIFTNNLSKYWLSNSNILISPGMIKIDGGGGGVLDKWVVDEGVPMYWATTVMFTKNTESKLFFDLVSFIKQNYQIYSEIYKFNPSVFRNDIAFSLAKHILHGYEIDKHNNLPLILTASDKDLIHSVNKDGIKLLINDSNDNTLLANITGRDIHVMNKQAIIREADALLGLI